LIIANRNLAPPNLSARNEIVINRIYLRYLVNPNYIFEEAVRNKLQSIANQCVFSGGLSVYNARTLYHIAEPGVQIDYSEIDSCHEVEDRSSDKNNFSNIYIPEVKIYPNPSTGIINIDLRKSFIKQLIVHDLLGKEVFYEKFADDKNTTQLNLLHLKGLYLVSVYDDIGLIRTEKLILN